MKDQLGRIETKLDKITDKLSSLDITTAQQQVTLNDHIRRTEILEGEVIPLKKHVDMVSGALKLIALAGTVAIIAEAVHLIMSRQ